MKQDRYPSFLAGCILSTVITALLAASPAAQAQRLHNMRLVGYNDLQARSAYQPIVQEQNRRYIAYIGHHGGEALNPLTRMVEPNGVSIVDVTYPRRPIYLHHLPATDGERQAQMVRACSGDELPNGRAGVTYLLRSNGNLSHQIYDVSDPRDPVLLSTPVTGLNGTHKSDWECSTGIAYLVGGVVAGTEVLGEPVYGPDEAWRTNRMTQVFDLSDPENPVFIRNFGLDGQQPGATVNPVPQSLHGCLSVQDYFPDYGENRGGRIYCGYGTRSNGVVQILDRSELLDTSGLSDDRRRNPTTEDLNAPVVGQINTPFYMGAHTTFPILDVEIEEFENDGPNTIKNRDILAIVNEEIPNECAGLNRQMVFFADITDEQHIWPISNYNVPESEGDYCSIGGRFGAHASNESFTEVFYKKLVFVSWFNAGVRAIDIRDPFNPKEAAYYVPRITADTDDRAGKFAIQTNNVEVDDRGFIYTADRANTGMHILELTGKAKKIADLP